MLLEREWLKVGVVPGLRQVQVRCKVGLGLWQGVGGGAMGEMMSDLRR